MKFLIHIALLSSAIHPLYETTKMEHILLTIIYFYRKMLENYRNSNVKLSSTD